MFNFSFGQYQTGASYNNNAFRFKGHTNELSHHDFMKYLSDKFPDSGITIPSLKKCKGVDKWLPSEMDDVERRLKKELSQKRQLEGQSLGPKWDVASSTRRPEEKVAAPALKTTKQRTFNKELEGQSLGTDWTAPTSARRAGSKLRPPLKRRKLHSDNN